MSSELAAQAEVELSSGIPFVSDADLEEGLTDAGVPADTADAIAEEYADARLRGLRAAISVLALIALIALLFTRRLPEEPVRRLLTREAVYAPTWRRPS